MGVCGLFGVLLAATVGLLSARSAVRPLGAAMEAQQRFVQNAGYELRTPLAVLDARLHLIQRREAAGVPVTVLLTGIVNDLLLTATAGQSTTDTAPTNTTETDAVAVITRTGEDLQLLARSSNIKLITEVQASVHVGVPAPSCTG
ncbi:HAMP domain-containing histidine kinase (plasmid) [Arthrobacter sp. TES]|uniref:HAMP domain-containing histidine kinase n=1 Tax=Paenarthrobacter ureafaciens TaxID=37931 RepID=UPI000395E5A4|nr:HAMP domain-containing histidine kinase [Paenarthrobacter ureafaciens]ERI38051.1 hypothetical protein M707_08335 [Arthrobacter sp. AK-YN10]QOI65750.1 HAMP domain-containing histidine kinase [Arthrobacter sp. TES]GLU61136.1 hypothetical protein Pure01_36490 [Paenarthrobacter ureafaciens]GLU65405.1 hypothetical protein Pure02_36550 [Paenarthrobacter ureafaciens]GLU69792.1 hypothetical protein Pure03_37680 [Paenarthrobacter ureafaciens]